MNRIAILLGFALLTAGPLRADLSFDLAPPKPRSAPVAEPEPPAPPAPAPRARATPAAEEVVEEVVTTRRVKVVAEPPAAPVSPAEPPLPPEPTAQDGSSPERIVRYFCTAWKNEDWERMYRAMDKRYRKGKSLRAFRKLFEEDGEVTAGLADENIEGKPVAKGGEMELVVTLRFQNTRVKPRVVRALVRRTVDGFRIVESGIIPVDLSDL